MRQIGFLFSESAREFRKLRHLVLISLFTALIVVGTLIRFPILPGNLEIRLSFVFASATGFMFGPVVACMAGIIADLLAFMINPGGAFNIGFTINAALGGIIYGIFLYKRNTVSPFFIIYVIVSKILVNIVINIVLTPIWLYGMYGSAGKIFTTARIYKNLALLPVEVIVIFIVLQSLPIILRKANLSE